MRRIVEIGTSQFVDVECKGVSDWIKLCTVMDIDRNKPSHWWCPRNHGTVYVEDTKSFGLSREKCWYGMEKENRRVQLANPGSPRSAVKPMFVYVCLFL